MSITKNFAFFSSANFPTMPSLEGVRMATAKAGIKQKDRVDLLFLIFDKGAKVAGVFTRSRCPSAPVDHSKNLLICGREACGLVVNAGNANAFTGKRGKETTYEIAKAASYVLGCKEENIYLASTGVIGEPLDADLIVRLLPKLATEAREDKWLAAARAIMTTDTFPKGATRTLCFDGQIITLNGIAKGSGMIAPNMATMLAFIVTDAPVNSAILQKILSNAVISSFNSITVDGDTSTSDTVLLFATGSASGRGVKEVTLKGSRYTVFLKAVKDLLFDLALQIVLDGEGAKKLIEVSVTGAVSNHSAKKIAKSIANSPLVKTAIGGEDANWGRVVMAVGKAGEKADRDLLSIWFGEQLLAINGERNPTYEEEIVSCYMKNHTITIRVDIGLGNGYAKIWTCDLTKEYVEINGDYRS